MNILSSLELKDLSKRLGLSFPDHILFIVNLSFKFLTFLTFSPELLISFFLRIRGKYIVNMAMHTILFIFPSVLSVMEDNALLLCPECLLLKL